PTVGGAWVGDWCRPRSRPRRWAGAASCRIEFEFDVQSVKDAPVRKSSAPATGTEVTGARRSSDKPNPAVPASSTAKLARPREAESSAPPSAPAPKQAVITPNVLGPEWSVNLASTGSSTLKLNAKVLTTATIASTSAERRDSRR